MKLFALALVFAIILMPAVAASKEPDVAAPAYDTATVVDVTGTIMEVKEIAKGNALEGVNLVVKVKGEALNVYIAPVEFVNMFDVKFVKGEDVEISGSKVKFEGADLLLSREVSIKHTMLTVRDKEGVPYWKFFLKTVPTGL